MNGRHNSNSDNLGEVKNTTFKFKNSDKDGSIFNAICGNDLKKEVAKNVKLSMKTDTVDIFITDPFCNAKTGNIRSSTMSLTTLILCQIVLKDMI
jgi:hypothetical protein